MMRDALSERWEAFLGACLSSGKPHRVASAANVVDNSFMLPELIDRWADWIEDQAEEMPATLVGSDLALRPDKEFREDICKHGFSYAVARIADKETAAEKLKGIFENPDELYQLFEDIRSGGKLSEHWARRLIDVGRVPEIRVYDLTAHCPIDPLGDDPSLWPSPLSGELAGPRLEGTVRGLARFAAQHAQVGLFALGSDEVFTRAPEFDAKRATKGADKRGNYFREETSLPAWRKLVGHGRREGTYVTEGEVDSAGQVRFAFEPIESARWLHDRVLVAVIAGASL